MYRCDICENVAPPGQVEKRHPVKRPDGSIQRELRVCKECSEQLEAGVPLTIVVKARAPKREFFGGAVLPMAPVHKPVALGRPAKAGGVRGFGKS